MKQRDMRVLNVCVAKAEWVMFEVGLWNIDRLTSTKFFRFQHWMYL